MNKDDGKLRSFDTGATRDTAEGKLDMEGFTHPMVMKQYAKFMNMNRLQSDGTLRDSDNWQKGIPIPVYMKSLTRHTDEVWEEYRGFNTDSGIVASLCGVMFNSMGMLLEILKERNFALQDFDGDEPTPEMRERQEKISLQETIPVEPRENWVHYYPSNPRGLCHLCLHGFARWSEHPCDICKVNPATSNIPNCESMWKERE